MPSPPAPAAPAPPATTTPAPATAAPAAPPDLVPPYTPGWNTSPPPTLTLQNLPPLLPYKKGLPVPPGYRVVHRSASGLTIGGGLTFLAAYAGALGLAASQSFENGMGYAAIPLAGPWAAIGGRTIQACKVPATGTTGAAAQRAINKCMANALDEILAIVFLTADGMIQAAGATLFFVGLASGYDELVRADLPKTAVVRLPEGGWALRVSGHF